MKKIKFKNKIYLLVGDMEKGGAIATKKQYQNGYMSFAHLFPEGNIKRFGKIIGTREDVQDMGKIKIQPKINVSDLFDIFFQNPS